MRPRSAEAIYRGMGLRPEPEPTAAISSGGTAAHADDGPSRTKAEVTPSDMFCWIQKEEPPQS